MGTLMVERVNSCSLPPLYHRLHSVEVFNPYFAVLLLQKKKMVGKIIIMINNWWEELHNSAKYQ